MALTVPSTISTSYVSPVRLSVTLRVSSAVATLPSPLAWVCSSAMRSPRSASTRIVTNPSRRAVRLRLRVSGGAGLALLVMLELGVDHRREDDREHQAEGDRDNDSLGSDLARKLRPREPDAGEDDRPDRQRGPDHEEEPEGEDHGAGNA